MCIAIENRNAQFTKSAIKNDELRAYANMLAEDAMNIRANLLHMSAIMAAIAVKADAQKKADEETILAQFGDSITTFGEERLGLKKSQVYSMVNVGTTFLDSDGVPLLTQRGGKWSNTQLMAMLPLAGTGKAKKSPSETLKAAQELVKSGDLKPSLTVAQIKAVVAEHRPDAAEKAAKAEKKAKADAEKAEQAEKVADELDTTVEAKVKGTRLGTIEMWNIDGNVHVLFNGEDVAFNESNIEALVTAMRKAVNYVK